MRNFEIKNQNGRSLLPICKADAPLFLSDVYNKRYMSEKITSRCQQSGRSMIEMLGVLAIIGVLSVGGIAGYSKAMMKYRINKTIEQITLISGNIRSFFATQGSYFGVGCYCNNSGCKDRSTVGCPIIKKAKIIPDEMLTLDADGKITAITNEFGYKTEIYEAPKHTNPDYKAFELRYYIGDNIEACIELMTNDWSEAGVKVFSLTDYKFKSDRFKVPVSVDLAAIKCSEVINRTTNKSIGYPFLGFYFDPDFREGSYWNSDSLNWQN